MMRLPTWDKLPNPLPGNGFRWTPSTRENWRARSVRFTFTTDAVVANRVFTAQLMTRDSTIVWQSVSEQNEAASNAFVVSFTDQGSPTSSNSAVADGLITAALPDFWLPPLWSLNFAVVNIDPGDTLTNITTLFEVFDEDSRDQLIEEMLGQ